VQRDDSIAAQKCIYLRFKIKKRGALATLQSSAKSFIGGKYAFEKLWIGVENF